MRNIRRFNVNGVINIKPNISTLIIKGATYKCKYNTDYKMVCKLNLILNDPNLFCF